MEVAIYSFGPRVLYTMTMKTPTLTAVLDGQKADLLAAAITTLEQGVTDKHIWNVDFTDAKSTLSYRIENAMQVIAEPCIDIYRADRDAHYGRSSYSDNDPRYDVSGYMDVNRAPKLLRRMEKAAKTDAAYAVPALATYMEALRELVEIGKIIKAVKPFIEKGRKPAENPKEVDLTNTGICTVCENRQKLTTTQAMVMHGYRISDGYGHYFGHRSGKCFGVNHKPYELSCEGNEAYLEYLKLELVQANKYVVRLRGAEMETLLVKEYVNHRLTTVSVERGTTKYERERLSRIIQVEGEIRQINSLIEYHTVKIANWTAQPLAYGASSK